jgi:hypothetical protein
MMFVPHRKHTYRASVPITGITLPFYMYIMLVPHRKDTYRLPRPVTGITVIFYM